MEQYLNNRIQFPLEELAKHAGQWVAWSPDGRRIVASSRNPADLDAAILAAGLDPEQCPIEGLPEGDTVIGGLDCP